MVLSAHDANDVRLLRQAMITFFEASMVEAELVVPYDKQGLLAEVYENARIIAEDYEEGSARLRVRGPPAAIAKLQRAFER